MHTLVSSGGVSAVHQGKKYGFLNASTDVAHCYENADINTIVIATQHDLHAQQVTAGLLAGKNVFVEKPLALSCKEIDSIEYLI